jgi:hypothetical protein
MADSDHSMNYACVTRRVALVGGAAIAGGALGTAVQVTAHASPLGMTSPADPSSNRLDPVIALWWEWAAAHARVQQLSQRLQDLEVELAERFDSFGTIVPVPDGKPAYVYSLPDLYRLVGDRTDMADIQTQAERELAAKQADFDGISEEIGYFPTMKAEQEAFTEAKSVLDQLAVIEATSLSGVAGKLDAVRRWGEAWDEHPAAFPWPQIRSAHADLVRLGRQMTPRAIYPG